MTRALLKIVDDWVVGPNPKDLAGIRAHNIGAGLIPSVPLVKMRKLQQGSYLGHITPATLPSESYINLHGFHDL